MLSLTPTISWSAFHIPDLHSQPSRAPRKKRMPEEPKSSKGRFHGLPNQDHMAMSHAVLWLPPKEEKVAPAFWTLAPHSGIPLSALHSTH